MCVHGCECVGDFPSNGHFHQGALQFLLSYKGFLFSGNSVHPAGQSEHCLYLILPFLSPLLPIHFTFCLPLFSAAQIESATLSVFLFSIQFIFFTLLVGRGKSREAASLIILVGYCDFFFSPLQLHQTLNIMVVSASSACFSSLSNLASVVGIAQAHDVNTWSFPSSTLTTNFQFVLVSCFLFFPCFGLKKNDFLCNNVTYPHLLPNTYF